MKPLQMHETITLVTLKRKKITLKIKNIIVHFCEDT